jgi:hypothetical protein
LSEAYGIAATSRHAKRPYSRRCTAPGPKTAEELNPYTPLVCYSESLAAACSVGLRSSACI